MSQRGTKVVFEASPLMNRESRERLIRALGERQGIESGLIYLEGNHEMYKNETDHELPFR